MQICSRSARMVIHWWLINSLSANFFFRFSGTDMQVWGSTATSVPGSLCHAGPAMVPNGWCQAMQLLEAREPHAPSIRTDCFDTWISQMQCPTDNHREVYVKKWAISLRLFCLNFQKNQLLILELQSQEPVDLSVGSPVSVKMVVEDSEVPWNYTKQRADLKDQFNW